MAASGMGANSQILKFAGVEIAPSVRAQTDCAVFMMSPGTERFGAVSSAECEERNTLFHKIRMKWVANMKRNATAAE